MTFGYAAEVMRRHGLRTTDSMTFHDLQRLLARPGPMALPTHRLCLACQRVYPLMSQWFYERQTRYPWTLSRFSSLCRSCHRAESQRNREAKRDQYRAVDREAKRRDRENRKQAPVFYTPTQLAIAERKRRGHLASKENKARIRKLYRIKYGPREDWVKRLIAERQAETIRRRLGRSPPEVLRRSLEQPESKDYPAALEALRARHRAVQGD